MKNDYRNIINIIGFISICWIVAVMSRCYFRMETKEIPQSVKIDTIETIKIVTDTIPIVKKEIVLQSKYDTIPVVINNTDTIQVPIEHQITQKTYSDDSTYTAYVSGCYSQLDSIKTYQKEKIITKEITQYRKKQWGFTIGVGTQYDVINKTPTLGFGLMWGYQF